MAGKATMIASRRLHYALDSLSKNALIDILTDRAIAQVGEDRATDEMLANTIQGWINPVQIVRNDRRIELRSLLARLDQKEEEYRRQQERAELRWNQSAEITAIHRQLDEYAGD